MAKKEIDRGKIVKLLKTEHFGDPGKPDTGDPVMETMIMLTCQFAAQNPPRNAAQFKLGDVAH